MAIKKINIGNSVNDGSGDDLRTAFNKVNENFAELNYEQGNYNLIAETSSAVTNFDLGSIIRSDIEEETVFLKWLEENIVMDLGFFNDPTTRIGGITAVGNGGPGYTGSQGVPGGYTGSKGYSGSRGYVGSIGPIGYTGSIGADGCMGLRGHPGEQGDKGGLRYNFNIITTPMNNPGVGDIRFNNSDAELTTQIYISNYIKSGADVSEFIATWGIARNPEKGILTISDNSNHIALSLLYTITGVTAGTAFHTVNVKYLSGTCVTPNDNEELSVEFTRSGSMGYTGSGSTVAGYTGSIGIGYTGSASEVRGYTGSKSTGFTGSAGKDGATAAVGYTGSKSLIVGPTGPSGPPGAAAAVGYAGSAGATGATGPAGATGPSGPPGAAASVGYSGSNGATGPAGATGPSGPPGINGEDGNKGDPGPPGATGPSASLSASPYIIKGKVATDISIPANTLDRVISFIPEVDPNNWDFMGKFLPTIPGYYNVSAFIWVYWDTALGVDDNSVHDANLQIVKNGTDRQALDTMRDDLNSNGVFNQNITNDLRRKTFNVSTIVYMNGTTDYIEFKFWSRWQAKIIASYTYPENGQTVQGSRYSANLITNGAGYTGSAGTGLATSDYIVKGKLETNATVPALTTDVIIPFIDDFDPNNWHTNNRFIPTIASYYQISVFAELFWPGQNIATEYDSNLQIIKNSSDRLAIDTFISIVDDTDPRRTLKTDTIVYMNGTTDYIEFKVYSKSAAQVIGLRTAGGATFVHSSYTAHLLAYSGGGKSTSNKMQVFTSPSGTFTIPSNVTSIKVTVVGGGGGSAGGSSTGTAFAGGGGGGGGTAIKVLNGLTPNSTLSVTVGTGGTAGITGSTGGNGGTSSIASGTQTIATVSATGGRGGVADPGSGQGSTSGGSGGVGSGGDLNIAGSGGGSGLVADPYGTGGTGGSSYFGGGAAANAGYYGATGQVGQNYGGGASGTSHSGTGFAGASGIVVVEWIEGGGQSNLDIYTGTNTENVNFPVGSYVSASLAEGGPGVNRNQHVSLYILDNLNKSLMYTTDNYGTIAQLTGTWAYRGMNLFQRVS
jgi:hypothetical protein